MYRTFEGDAPGLAGLNFGQDFSGVPDHILVAIIRHRGGFAGFPGRSAPRRAGEMIGEGGLRVGMRIANVFGHEWDVTGIKGWDVTVVGPSGKASTLNLHSIETNCTLADDFPRRST